MEDLAQADIFFFVTTIAVVVITVLLVVLLVYAIKFVRDARVIAKMVLDEAHEIMDDVDEFRKNVKHKAGRISGLLGVVTTARFIRRIFKD